VVTICNTWFHIQKFYVMPARCICVFFMGFTTNSEYFLITHVCKTGNRVGTQGILFSFFKNEHLWNRGDGGTFEQNSDIFSSLWKTFYSLQVVLCCKDIVFCIYEMRLKHIIKSHFYVTNIFLWRCITYKSYPWLGYILTPMGHFWTQNYWK
jgi:hypothetical protein